MRRFLKQYRATCIALAMLLVSIRFGSRSQTCLSVVFVLVAIAMFVHSVVVGEWDD